MFLVFWMEDLKRMRRNLRINGGMRLNRLRKGENRVGVEIRLNGEIGVLKAGKRVSVATGYVSRRD